MLEFSAANAPAASLPSYDPAGKPASYPHPVSVFTVAASLNRCELQVTFSPRGEKQAHVVIFDQAGDAGRRVSLCREQANGTLYVEPASKGLPCTFEESLGFGAAGLELQAGAELMQAIRAEVLGSPSLFGKWVGVTVADRYYLPAAKPGTLELYAVKADSSAFLSASSNLEELQARAAAHAKQGLAFAFGGPSRHYSAPKVGSRTRYEIRQL